jgi:hypothetical protein
VGASRSKQASQRQPGLNLVEAMTCGLEQPLARLGRRRAARSAGQQSQHWHGASPTTAMTHIAMQEELGGKVVDWMEKVTDEQYDTSPRSA